MYLRKKQLYSYRDWKDAWQSEVTSQGQENMEYLSHSHAYVSVLYKTFDNSNKHMHTHVEFSTVIGYVMHIE